MSLSASVVDVVAVGDVTSRPRNHCDWMMRSFTAAKFGGKKKKNQPPTPKIKGATFSTR